MRKVFSLTSLLATTLFTAAATSATDTAQDPFLWLEAAHGKRAMQWVRAENAKTTAALDNDALFQQLFAEAKTIAEAPDRIPFPEIYRGGVLNFWQDAQHTHGIYRMTDQADFKTAAPHWRTVLDLDAISKTEKANWFLQGTACYEPKQRPCMVSLSDGGEDASTLREFDFDSGKFVAGGFVLLEGSKVPPGSPKIRSWWRASGRPESSRFPVIPTSSNDSCAAARCRLPSKYSVDRRTMCKWHRSSWPMEAAITFC